MKEIEKHETVKQLKKEGFWIAMSGCFFSVLSGSFFAIEYINYGLMCLTVAIVLFCMCLLVAVKIHSRYTQELILKINGKKWEDYCDCDECKAQRNLDKGVGK